MKLLRWYLALILGKLVGLVCRWLPFGGGSSLPGLITNWIDPYFLDQVQSSQYLKSIIITGTNGKTTTSRLIGNIFDQAGKKHIHNRRGSNLLRGVTSTLITQMSFSGKLFASLAVWEIDEAVIPEAVKKLRPQVIIFTNLFRDQLDRYGEINTILEKWQKSLQSISSETWLVINHDDPSLQYLSQKHRYQTQIIAYGLEDNTIGNNSLADAADAIFCPFCHQPLDFTHIYTSHLGHYHCPSCQFTRTKPTVFIKKAIINNANSELVIKTSQQLLSIKSRLPGVYNLYNALAALATARIFKISPKIIKEAIAKFQPAFGRAEKFSIDHGFAHILLVKNPAGFNAVLETLEAQKHLDSQPLLIAINDLIADGTDVSWLWDVNFELLKSRRQPIIVTGLRADDMALRLKYAGVEPDLIKTESSLKTALKKITQSWSTPAYILPTYTAMLAIRKILNQERLLHSTWKD